MTPFLWVAGEALRTPAVWLVVVDVAEGIGATRIIIRARIYTALVDAS